MTMLKDYYTGRLHIMVFDTREAMGRKAGEQAARRIRDLLGDKEVVNVIFAAAPSQNETLKTLVNADGIDWTRVNAYHMDEYVGLDPGHPAGFCNYLKRMVFDLLPFRSINLINGNTDNPDAEALRYSRLLEKNPADICLLGVGENGHLAFNDPPVADFRQDQQYPGHRPWNGDHTEYRTHDERHHRGEKHSGKRQPVCGCRYL